MSNNRKFKLIAIAFFNFLVASAYASSPPPNVVKIEVPEAFTASELSPPVLIGEPILFVDMTCMLCKSLIHEIKGKYDNLKLVFVRVIPPAKSSTNQMLWHLSDTSRFGMLDGGCVSNCSTVQSIGTEPDQMEYVSDSINYSKRLISIGINSAMHRAAFKDGETPKVPALYINNEAHVINNENELAQMLGLGDI